jgi:hypothetical protein
MPSKHIKNWEPLSATNCALVQQFDKFSDDHNTVKVRTHTEHPTADILPQRSSTCAKTSSLSPQFARETDSND